MQRVVLFGAGEAGRFFCEKYADRYDILAVLDNDTRKQGQQFCGVPVVAPNTLCDFAYDNIIVTSIFVHQIQQQLITELGVPEDRIFFSPKEVIDSKSGRPFSDPETLNLAREMLLFLSKILEGCGLRFFIDHGTLLGIVRDGDLLPWDDDVDISVMAEEAEKVIRCIRDHYEHLPRVDQVRWQVILGVEEERLGLEPRNLFLSLVPGDLNGIRQFNVDLSFIHIEGDRAIQMINDSPAEYFLSVDYIDFCGKKVGAPKNYRDYLTFHYGDWRVPKQQISFHDILNFAEPRAPTKRVRLL